MFLQIVEHSTRYTEGEQQRVGCLRPTKLTIEHGPEAWVLTAALETQRVSYMCTLVKHLELHSSLLDLTAAKVRILPVQYAACTGCQYITSCSVLLHL